MFAYAKPEQKQDSKSTVQKKEPEKAVAAPNQTGIPDTMKTHFESLSGFSFDDVRMNYNSGKPNNLLLNDGVLYKAESNLSPIQFKLRDADIDSITKSNMDSRIINEFNSVYLPNQDYINYSKSNKGGEATVKNGQLTANVVDTKGFFGESKVNAILRQSAIVHEVTHLAVIKYNRYRNPELMSIKNPDLASLKKMAAPKTQHDLQDKLKSINDVIDSEKVLLSSFKYGFDDVRNDLYRYTKYRLAYLGMTLVNNPAEYPAVINELHYLFSEINDRKFSSTETDRLLNRLAIESMEDRDLAALQPSLD